MRPKMLPLTFLSCWILMSFCLSGMAQNAPYFYLQPDFIGGGYYLDLETGYRVPEFDFDENREVLKAPLGISASPYTNLVSREAWVGNTHYWMDEIPSLFRKTGMKGEEEQFYFEEPGVPYPRFSMEPLDSTIWVQVYKDSAFVLKKFNQDGSWAYRTEIPRHIILDHPRKHLFISQAQHQFKSHKVFTVRDSVQGEIGMIILDKRTGKTQEVAGADWVGLNDEDGEMQGNVLVSHQEKALLYMNEKAEEVWRYQDSLLTSNIDNCTGFCIPGIEKEKYFIHCQSASSGNLHRCMIFNQKTGKPDWEGLAAAWPDGEIKQTNGWLLIKYQTNLLIYQRNQGSNVTVFNFPTGNAVFNDYTFNQW